MTEVASRQILWNVSAIENVLLMYALFGISLIVCAAGLVRHAEIWLNGRASPLSRAAWYERLDHFIGWVLLQRGVNRERSVALAHSAIFVGFIVLLFTTTMVLLDHDFGIPIYRGDFYLAVTLLSDVFGLLVLLGCAIFAHRRYIARIDRVHSRHADAILLGGIALMCAQGFLLEGLRIHATSDRWASFSPVGKLVAHFFWSVSPQAAATLHYGTWWFHTATVFAFIALLPYTKFFHLVASSCNLFFNDFKRPRGMLPFPGDLVQRMESGEDFTIGTGSIKDYSWKQLMDLDACTSCGRCQDACPAYRSGKPLSPKWLILDTRNHAQKLGADGTLAPSRLPASLAALDGALTRATFLRQNGLKQQDNGALRYDNEGAFRSANQLVQRSALSLGQSSDAYIAGDVLEPGVFWSCTTCYACVDACPVGINHVDHIIENRRHMALMRGEIPAEAQQTLKKLESQANPFGDASDRSNWLEGLGVQVLKPGDSVDYLYWVGCVSAFDPRKQRIAKSLVRIMQHAGLSFGVLGNAEGCSGDPARRLGEENLFQTLAKNNIETLRTVRFKTIVANCPHCFNTLKNEYPQLGNLGEGKSPEIIHHAVLLKRLMSEGRIAMRGEDGSATDFTFHDPCYLGRYNGEFEAPRSALGSIKGLRILEMEENRERGMCCGAGGGHFWMDLKIGDRINTIRTDHAAATGASNIATACPFCLQMMEDGVKLTNRESSLAVRDIAEVIAERLS